MSGPYAAEPVSLSEQLLAYYRRTLAIHADDPVLHACLICKQRRCPNWRLAWERLACAGALPTEAQQPDDPTKKGQPVTHPDGHSATGSCPRERTDELCRP